MTAPWSDPTRTVSERVDSLLAQLTLEEKVAQLGSRWVGNDMHDADPRQSTAAEADHQRRADAGRLRRLRHRCRWRTPAGHGLGHLTRVFGSYPLTAGRGRRRGGPAAADRRGELPPGHPGAGPRGVPDRVHHLRRDGLPGRDRLGRHLRPRPDRADGRGDRAGHGRGRRAPGAVAGARRGPRLPLGPGRGDHGRGPVPGVDARRRVRPGSAERRRHRHPEALRRVLRLPRRAQPRPGADGPARADGRHPAAVRDGHRRGRRRLGDELLLRRRRRAGRRRPVAADRPAARRLGLHRHRGLRLLGGAVPGHHAPGRRGHRRGRRAGARRRHRRRTAGHPRLRRRPGGAGPPRRARRGARRPGRPPPAHPEGRARPARPGLDAGGLGGRRGRRRPGLARPTGRSPARWPSGPSCCSTPGPRCRWRRRPAQAWPWSGRAPSDPRTFMGCYAFPNHVLPRYPGRGLGIEVPTVVDALRAELPDAEIVHERGLRGGQRRPVRLRRRASPRPGTRTCAWSSSATWPGCSATASSGEGCDAEDLRLPGVQADLVDELLDTGTPVVVVVVSGRPYALGEVHGRAAGLVQAFMPGEEGGAAIAGVLSRPDQPGRQAAGADPAGPGRAAGHLPAAAARRARAPGSAPWTPRRCSRSGTAPRTPPSSVDDLRISDKEVPTDGEFTGHGPGPQHRRARPATRWSSSTCATWSAR